MHPHSDLTCDPHALPGESGGQGLGPPAPLGVIEVHGEEASDGAFIHADGSSARSGGVRSYARNFARSASGHGAERPTLTSVWT